MIDKNSLLIILGLIASVLFTFSFGTGEIIENYSTGLANGFNAVSHPYLQSCTKPDKLYPVPPTYENLIQLKEASNNGKPINPQINFPSVAYPSYSKTLNNRFSSTGLPQETKLRPAASSQQGVDNKNVAVVSSPSSSPFPSRSSVSFLSNPSPSPTTSATPLAEYYDGKIPTQAYKNPYAKDPLKNPSETDYQNIVEDLRKGNMEVIKPPTCMDYVTDEGETDQVFVTNRFIYSNKKSRLNAVGNTDFIRGDPFVVPNANSGWFTPLGAYNPANSLKVGALSILGGDNNESEKRTLALKNLYGSGSTFASLSKEQQNAYNNGAINVTQKIPLRELSSGDIMYETLS